MYKLYKISSAIRIKITYTVECGIPADYVKRQKNVNIQFFIVKEFLNSGKFLLFISP